MSRGIAVNQSRRIYFKKFFYAFSYGCRCFNAWIADTEIINLVFTLNALADELIAKNHLTGEEIETLFSAYDIRK